MRFIEFHKQLDPEVFSDFPGELGIFANHYDNKIVLQLRVNGEMDSTYEVKSKGLDDTEARFVLDGGDDGSDYAPVNDPLSHYDVITKLGDSNDMKIPIICTQIAQLYERVILPTLGSQVGGGVPDFVITLSTKLWRKSQSNEFEKLIFLLNAVKEAYVN
ncbi:Irc25 [Kluyveromyces lactis]|nr:Irc25 [Kluyveromyces lactis]